MVTPALLLLKYAKRDYYPRKLDPCTIGTGSGIWLPAGCPFSFRAPAWWIDSNQKALQNGLCVEHAQSTSPSCISCYTSGTSYRCDKGVPQGQITLVYCLQWHLVPLQVILKADQGYEETKKLFTWRVEFVNWVNTKALYRNEWGHLKAP